MLNYLHVDDELLVNPPAMRARPPSVHQAAAPSQSLLSALVEGMEPEPVRELVKRIFTDLTRLIGYLGWIGDDLCQDESLDESFDETLPKFTLVQGEALFLASFINTQVSHLEGLPEATREALDGISYVIGHELHRVFEDNLKGLHELQRHSLVRARVEHAHGILSNCFQQSAIVLARVFDPTLDSGQLFNDAQVRREQSLVLYHDLSTLAQLVRSAERSGDQHLCDLLIKSLTDFRDGSMRYLMFRDWGFCERFVEQLIESRDTTEFTDVLHRLDCYLEMLHAHVRMRAVITESECARYSPTNLQTVSTPRMSIESMVARSAPPATQRFTREMPTRGSIKVGLMRWIALGAGVCLLFRLVMSRARTRD